MTYWYSTNRAIKPAGSWLRCEFVISPKMVKDATEVRKIIIFKLHTKRSMINRRSYTHNVSIDLQYVIYLFQSDEGT